MNQLKLWHQHCSNPCTHTSLFLDTCALHQAAFHTDCEINAHLMRRVWTSAEDIETRSKVNCMCTSFVR
jgi:hypothetical protein